MTVFADGRPVDEGARLVDLGCPPRAFAHIRNLLWHCRLSTDLTVPVDAETGLWTTRGGVPCPCGK